VEQNKRTVERYMEVMCTGDFDALRELMTDDAHWTVPGDLPVSGRHSMYEIKQILGQMAGQFAGLGAWKATGMIAEGDTVAAEAISSIDTRSGREYRNRYHIVFHFRDGKISDLVEYCGTKHLHDIFLS
jgi:uncharacterized protein